MNIKEPHVERIIKQGPVVTVNKSTAVCFPIAFLTFHKTHKFLIIITSDYYYYYGYYRYHCSYYYYVNMPNVVNMVTEFRQRGLSRSHHRSLSVHHIVITNCAT
jgi:hypothetical protein